MSENMLRIFAIAVGGPLVVAFIYWLQDVIDRRKSTAAKAAERRTRMRD